MNIKIPAIATAAVLLAACGGPGNESAERAMMNAPPAPSPMMEQDVAMDGSFSKSGGGGRPRRPRNNISPIRTHSDCGCQ